MDSKVINNFSESINMISNLNYLFKLMTKLDSMCKINLKKSANTLISVLYVYFAYLYDINSVCVYETCRFT